MPGQGEAYGVDGAYCAAPTGFDRGPDVGIVLRAPFATKAIGYFSIDSAGPEGALRFIVGGFELSTGDEDEEMAADFGDDVALVAPSFAGRGQLHQVGEAPKEFVLIGLERAVAEVLAPPADGAGVFEQRLDFRSEQIIAGVDGVLSIADEVSQTILMVGCGPAELAAIAVG